MIKDQYTNRTDLTSRQKYLIRNKDRIAARQRVYFARPESREKRRIKGKAQRALEAQKRARAAVADGAVGFVKARIFETCHLSALGKTPKEIVEYLLLPEDVVKAILAVYRFND